MTAFLARNDVPLRVQEYKQTKMNNVPRRVQEYKQTKNVSLYRENMFTVNMSFKYVKRITSGFIDALKIYMFLCMTFEKIVIYTEHLLVFF